jgi:hypothetical protein
MFEHLLSRLITISDVSRQPRSARGKQLLDSVADSSIRIEVLSGNHADSSVITVCSRLVITANGIGQTHDQGLQEKAVSRGHSESRA